MLFLTLWLLITYLKCLMLRMSLVYVFTPVKDIVNDKPLSSAWISAAVWVLFILFCLPLLRPGLESITDRVTLSDYEARRLLNALVKEFIQMTAEELEQASEGNR